jgi:hypothetical protein
MVRYKSLTLFSTKFTIEMAEFTCFGGVEQASLPFLKKIGVNDISFFCKLDSL